MKINHLDHQYIDLYNKILVFSFVSLWLSIKLPEQLENTIAYALIMTVGVVHGANDLKVYFNTKKTSLTRIILFITFYMVIVGMGFAAFFIIPDVILSLFIVASGYHFGQEHFEKFEVPRSPGQRLLELFYGLTIIVTILYVNAQESLPILDDLLSTSLTSTFLFNILIICAAATIILGVVYLRTLSWSAIAMELLYLFVLYIIFMSSTLVWSFAIYFVLWHSVPSINHQIRHLYGGVNGLFIWKYIKSSFLYWMASLIFLGGLYYFLWDDEKLFLTILVAFLGGITFPHMIVMNKLHKT